MLARKSLPTRIWMATGKKVYYWITRGLFNFTDREGGGPRLVHDAPRSRPSSRSFPGVRDAAIVAFPDRRTGTGLYAFVEATPAVSERELIDYISDGLGAANRPGADPGRRRIAAPSERRGPHRNPAARRA